MFRYTLRQLEYFVAVGECGSIALASEKINVSSPSISTAITQLESAFGLQLFVRHQAQGLVLSSVGKRMILQAKTVLSEASDLMVLAGDISGSVRGPLSIGCLVTFAQVVLPTVRRSFAARYEDVRMRQFELNQVEIFSALRRAEIDLALTYDLDLPSDLKFVPVLDLPPFVLVGADHPFANRDSVAIEDLQPYPMVLLDLPLSSDYFLSFFAGTGAKPIIAERTRDMAVMRSMVGNGFGYSIANVRPLKDEAPDGNMLHFLAIEGDVRPMRMGLLMTEDADNANVVRAFVEHCKEQRETGVLPSLIGVAGS